MFVEQAQHEYRIEITTRAWSRLAKLHPLPSTQTSSNLHPWAARLEVDWKVTVEYLTVFSGDHPKPT
jgi:hypothetical protein